MYQNYDQGTLSEKLYYDLFRNLSRNTGQEIALKARVSKGMTVTEYFGGFGLR